MLQGGQSNPLTHCAPATCPSGRESMSFPLHLCGSCDLRSLQNETAVTLGQSGLGLALQRPGRVCPGFHGEHCHAEGKLA